MDFTTKLVPFEIANPRRGAHSGRAIAAFRKYHCSPLRYLCAGGGGTPTSFAERGLI